MANPEHLNIFKSGVEKWNSWREQHHNLRADLSEANLTGSVFKGRNLCGVDLVRAILCHADLSEANLRRADATEVDLVGASLLGADLTEAGLRGADLSFANLSEANLSGADLSYSRLAEADLCKANLRGAHLIGATLLHTKLESADLTGCRVHGVSAWNLELEGAKQSDLVITQDGEPTITVDNLEMAQFVYLLLNNEKIRQVIDTITSKVVLILGRFSEERKVILDAIREELRRRDFTPVLFDFDKPASKDVTGTVETLARMARFIVADLTDPSSIPHELATIVPFLRTTPVLPLRLAGSSGYSMFDDLQKGYCWVLNTHEYEDSPSLITGLPQVIAPADDMARQFRKE